MSNHLLECEEVAAYAQSNFLSDDISNEEKSDFTYSLYPNTQGELQINSYESLNEIENETFVFLIEGVHE